MPINSHKDTIGLHMSAPAVPANRKREYYTRLRGANNMVLMGWTPPDCGAIFENCASVSQN